MGEAADEIARAVVRDPEMAQKKLARPAHSNATPSSAS